jgi:hypothetical protein
LKQKGKFVTQMTQDKQKLFETELEILKLLASKKE